MTPDRYQKVLIKLSGEALMGAQGHGICIKTLQYVASEICAAHELGVEIAIVVGGGNIFRGVAASSYGMDRTSADHMGMLATVLNSIALQNALEQKGVSTRIQTAISMHRVAEPYIRRRAIRHLEKGRIVIFAAGTGNPYFTTDTAAVLRAEEIGAQVLMKATKVDGLYDSDPETHKDAKFIEKTNYMHVLEKQFKVMDMTAISLAMQNNLPVMIFNLTSPGNILKAVQGLSVGSLVTN